MHIFIPLLFYLLPPQNTNSTCVERPTLVPRIARLIHRSADLVGERPKPISAAWVPSRSSPVEHCNPQGRRCKGRGNEWQDKIMGIICYEVTFYFMGNIFLLIIISREIKITSFLSNYSNFQKWSNIFNTFTKTWITPQIIYQ